ncbi:GTP-binding protein [Paenibacillus sp. BC26]|uniref:CobW family GTP-binding protein n=1 Tax=Paenibacillus sp. BC26 TaxID=1881032 RepID=UPI0008F26221|nr:CobW family GTP-binding protein [Paenibacillus sp. BC26]SFT16397.1 Cobalamin synthesis protein cobW C-terminal domain-containing protein [Paenibacillus sp. BC26]
MEQSAIPVIVLSGFLGSGKTTLLLRLLQHAKATGLRASVLMNEIGAVDVDGTMVSSASATQMLERITEGCLCCSKKSELASCLERLALMQPDVIVMELTGVANPEEIAEAITEPIIIGKVRLHRIVTVLDAEHALDYNSIFSSDRELIRTLRKQIEVADFIIANKYDLISNRTADKVKQLIRDRNPAADFITATRCEIDSALVFAGISPSGARRQPVISGMRTAIATGGRVLPEKLPGSGGGKSPAPAGKPAAAMQPGAAPTATKAPSSYSRIRTAAIYPGADAAGLTRRQFEAFIGGRGNNCMRAKGYLPFGKDGSLMLFQLAGKRLEWSPSSYEGEPYFVMIGIELDESKVKQEWARFTARK